MGTNVERRVALALVFALALTAVVPPAVASGANGSAGTAQEFDGVEPRVGALQQNNTTAVRHEDPDETDEAGDLGGVSSHLAGRMGEISVDCSEGIRVGDYDACEELDENGEYGDALSKYVDVTGRDGGGSGDDDGDDGSDESFRDLQQEQQEFANETQRFQRTYQEYQEARRNGNTTRARRLARELLELREEIQESGQNVSRASNDIENGTGVSLDVVEQSTQAVTANVTDTTNTVVTEVFIPTAMTATREGKGNVSAREPLVVTGQVRTANGTAVGNGSVVVATGPRRGSRVVQRTRVPVNDAGGYELTYRPTTVRTGNRTMSMRYEPPATSVYLGANETVSTTVEEVQANLSVSDTTGERRYREPVRATARVTVTDDGESLALREIPLRLALDGRTLGTGATNTSGVAVLGARLPASIATGNRTLSVDGPSSGRAVTVAPARRGVRVVVSEPRLQARAVPTGTGQQSVRVVGQLRAQGAGVPGRELEVSIDGRFVTTLETNATGDYRETLTVPNASFPATGQESVDVVVAFDGSGTNLESASTREEVALQSGATASSDGLLSRITGFVQSNPVAVGGVALFGLLAAGGLVLVRRRSEGESADASEAGEVPTASTDDGDAVDDARHDSSVEAVREALSDGAHARAVLSGYATVRRGLPVTDAPTVTHWEFYRRAAESGLSASQLAALRDVTEAFERVSFAGQTPDETEASTVLERVRDALEGDEGDVDPAGADD